MPRLRAKKEEIVETRAEHNIRWCEEHLFIPEGKDVGLPLKMAEFMKEDFVAIYDNPSGPTRRAIISRGRKNAKALALDTPIPAPHGWRMMADIEVGDLVFGSQGTPVRVTATSQIFLNKNVMRLVFPTVLRSLHRKITSGRRDIGLQPLLICLRGIVLSSTGIDGKAAS